jgi:hypothetical protein
VCILEDVDIDKLQIILIKALYAHVEARECVHVTKSDIMNVQ